MIHVIATIDLHAGQRAAFLEEFHALMPHVLAEDGCLEYGPTVDVDSGLAVQSPLRPDTVTVVEKWRDVPALKAHLNAPHMLEYRPKVKDFVANVKLIVLQPA